jgi:PIN domain-containing protein
LETYYLDASLQVDVCRALDLVRNDIQYPGKPGCSITDPKMRDEEWLPVAGSLNWVVLMRDKHIRTRTAERDALTRAGLRTFCLTGAGNYSKWKTVDLLVRKWNEIEQKAAQSGPYIYSVTQAGLKQLL